jgi:hypothetical protein
MRLSNLATALVLATTTPACGTMERVVPSSNATNIQDNTSKEAMVCIEGGPLTQCCHVSPNDIKAMQMAKEKQKVPLCNEGQTIAFFACYEGSRMEADEKGRFACLESNFPSVEAKEKTCTIGTIEPIIKCDPSKGTKTINWSCYNGPYQVD